MSTMALNLTVAPPSTRAANMVLVVDDDRIMRMTLVSQLEALGYETLEADNGQTALNVLREQGSQIDTILLDREMPVMDGLQVVQRMKEDPRLRSMPIIMQTGSDKPEQVRQGIDAGVFYYLTKPVNPEILRSVLLAALREANQKKTLATELQKHKTSFNLIEEATFTLSTISEAENLSVFLANCFPTPERVVGGLVELLVNAIEHGNLEVGYQLKGQLIATGTWAQEIDRRLKLPEFASRRVHVTYRRANDGHFVVIRDQGRGFDWKSFLQIDPARAMDNHGRGIAQANALSFDKLAYNVAGNEVAAFCGREKVLEW